MWTVDCNPVYLARPNSPKLTKRKPLSPTIAFFGRPIKTSTIDS